MNDVREFMHRIPVLLTIEEVSFCDKDPNAALDAAEARVEKYNSDGKAAHIISRPRMAGLGGEWKFTVRAYLPSSV